MAGPSEGGGMLEVVGAQRRDVLTAGDVAETERDALGNVSEGAGPLDQAGGPAATAKGRPSRPDAPEGGLGDKLSQPAGDRRAAAAMRSRVEAAKLAIAREAVSQLDDSEELEGASGMYDAGRAAKKAAGVFRQAPVSEISIRPFHSSSCNFFTIRHGMPGCRRQPAAAASARISEFLTR